MIELRHIKKYYKMGDNIVKALDDINLKVNDGEFVTIIGPSGSGKSTMMNIVGCLDKATSGQYLVDGIEISKFSENQLAFLRNKKMGFIFQGFNLLANLSAYENVELPLIYQGISKQERKKRVTNALLMVGMGERMKHKPSELSGGQQQRVAIARALATRPMCILADEPTGNLDSVTGDEIMKILKRLNDKGTTVIIITHNDDIAKLSRRVVRIHDGKIDSDEINENIKSYGNSVDEIEKSESPQENETERIVRSINEISQNEDNASVTNINQESHSEKSARLDLKEINSKKIKIKSKKRIKE